MFYLGLDLGKKQDFSALAVVERTQHRELVVRYLERAPLGTPYTKVVQRVAELTRHPNLNGRCHLTVDATGLGVPVVELLSAAQMGTRAITAVTITGGNRARQASGFGLGEHWNVPKVDLIGGLQVALERGELKIVKAMRESGTLVRELIRMRTRRRKAAAEDGDGGAWFDSGTEHDDLVLGVSLGCWQAGRPLNGMGTQRLF